MRLAVCSWSLLHSDPRDLVEKARKCGVSAVQLALGPVREAWGIDETRCAFEEGEVTISSGMMAMQGEDYSSLVSIRETGGVRPDEDWEANRAAAGEDARVARELGLSLVTFHAGFIPHEEGDPLRARMIERLRVVVDLFAAESVKIAFETGQETAETLLAALRELDRPDVGVNFDPANMILYGMGDPIDAVRRLAPRIAQVHIKDALPAASEGEWGTEVVAGSGEVDWRRFLGVISALEPGVDLVIERESGEDREVDVRTAVAMVRQTLADLGQEIPS
jgi:L-ribulose-5-phosphate 3-epimerase